MLPDLTILTTFWLFVYSVTVLLLSLLSIDNLVISTAFISLQIELCKVPLEVHITVRTLHWKSCPSKLACICVHYRLWYESIALRKKPILMANILNCAIKNNSSVLISFVIKMGQFHDTELAIIKCKTLIIIDQILPKLGWKEAIVPTILAKILLVRVTGFYTRSFILS